MKKPACYDAKICFPYAKELFVRQRVDNVVKRVMVY